MPPPDANSLVPAGNGSDRKCITPAPPNNAIATANAMRPSRVQRGGCATGSETATGCQSSRNDGNAAAGALAASGGWFGAGGYCDGEATVVTGVAARAAAAAMPACTTGSGSPHCAQESPLPSKRYPHDPHLRIDSYRFVPVAP